MIRTLSRGQRPSVNLLAGYSERKELRYNLISAMNDLERTIGRVVVLLLTAVSLTAQPRANGAGPGERGRIVGSANAIAGSKEDPSAADRGGKIFVTQCGQCHGDSAKGRDRGPNLIYSLAVLRDEQGSLIAPILRNGHGTPEPALTGQQIGDVVAWLHVQIYAAGHRFTYEWLDVVTGDPKKGEAYFNTVGRCNTCHSVTGDLAGLAKRYDPFTLQSRWVLPTPDSRRAATKVTVTLPSGRSFSGQLDRIDDFSVSLRDSSGEYRSFIREGVTPVVDIDDPLKFHNEMLRQYKDADIHNVTAYLVTLK
jgi:cytochrome c oxidase cbb3-type subunit III